MRPRRSRHWPTPRRRITPPKRRNRRMQYLVNRTRRRLRTKRPWTPRRQRGLPPKTLRTVPSALSTKSKQALVHPPLPNSQRGYATWKSDQSNYDAAQAVLLEINKTGTKNEIAQAAQRVKSAKEKLDVSASAQLASQQAQPKYIETFTLTPLAIVPDDSQRFVANLSHSKWRDDTLKLSVVNGLLTSTAAQSTDQTASIVSSLVSAAVGIVTFVGAGIPIVPGANGPSGRGVRASEPVCTA